MVLSLIVQQISLKKILLRQSPLNIHIKTKFLFTTNHIRFKIYLQNDYTITLTGISNLNKAIARTIMKKLPSFNLNINNTFDIKI